MKLNVLISTLNNGIERVPHILLAPRTDVAYIVSMQYTDEVYLQQIPTELQERSDVQVVTMAGKGLSRNRNNAMRYATGDIALIADDDVRYKNEYFDSIIATFEQHTTLDVAHFMIKATDGNYIKAYPNHSYTYPHIPKGMYVTSPEIVVRISSVRNKLYFDERFGLGSPHFVCGEEEIFLYEAHRMGMDIRFFPQCVVEAPSDSTGTRTYTDERVMMAKGAMHYYLHGASAWLRMFKFALTAALSRKGNFGTLLRNTFKGIDYYRKVVRYEDSTGR